MYSSTARGLLLFVLLSSHLSFQVLCHQLADGYKATEKGLGRRVLVGFEERPRGSNRTFQCSPSGPCIPCLYSEKRDEKYRCSETGYRIPFKCIQLKDDWEDTQGKNSNDDRSSMEVPDDRKKFGGTLDNAEVTPHRGLEDVSSTLDDGSQAYITYRSCIPAVNEEKLSVIRFEGIMLCTVLLSGLVLYSRRKQTVSLPGFGAGRVQTNSRY